MTENPLIHPIDLDPWGKVSRRRGKAILVKDLEGQRRDPAQIQLA
ncbi:MAG: hypothetical protein SNJ85_09435 [Cyanobacteriota bacterium]